MWPVSNGLDTVYQDFKPDSVEYLMSLSSGMLLDLKARSKICLIQHQIKCPPKENVPDDILISPT